MRRYKPERPWICRGKNHDMPPNTWATRFSVYRASALVCDDCILEAGMTVRKAQWEAVDREWGWERIG